MELSSFLKKLKGKPEQEPQLFLAVQIDDEFVKTAIWTVKQEATSLVAAGSTQDWDGSSTEILIEAVDASLTVALGKLSPENTAEPNQVIFGLPETWVGTEGISPARLKDLKSICEKLELDPVGFVVTTEAITHYLKSKEGTPLSAILARISTTEVTVSIIRLGNIEGTHVVGRSGDLAGDVREGLTRFGDQESLPARMIIYDGGEDSMEDLTQQLMAFDWQSYLPFLHMPHIEAVPEIFSIAAIAVAGGSEVAKSLGFNITHISPPEPEQKSESVFETEKEKPESIEPEPELKPEPETAINTQPLTPPSAAAEIPASPRWPSSSGISPVLTLLKKTINRITSSVPRRFPIKYFRFGVSKLAIITAAIIFLIIFGTIIAAKRLSRATLRLTFQSQTLNHKARLTVDPSAQEVNPDTAVLPASPITVTKSGQKTADTTGKKTVGDKAKGEVTIYNRRTDGGKTFSAGTVISADKIEFTLDSEVQVASASAGADYSIVPGKAEKVAVTARDFGPESNLAAGSEFQINTFSKSAYVAKNDAALIGGTKRDIQVAGAKDLSDLKKNLLDELKSQAAGDIESSSADRQVFPDTLTATSEEEKYSASAGEEAESVTLELTAKVTALAVEKQNLQNLLSALLRDAIPSGFTLTLEDLKVDIENITLNDQTVSFDAVVTAILSPTVDRTEIIKMVLGKRPQAALNQVKNLPHFRVADLQISPKFPLLLQWLPVDEKRLNLEIKLED